VTAPLDTSRAITGPNARLRLVEAIRDAAPGVQETDWLEWKSAADLEDKAWQGETATHLIGFANRDPSRARRIVDGCGYIALGVEPGRISGVAVLDPADLENRIARYVGPDLRWEPHYVHLQEATVLVVEVAAPRQGDPLFALRRTFQDPTGKSIPNGTVFVRIGGKTERASAAEIDMLSRRAAVTAGNVLDLKVEWWDSVGEIAALDRTEAAHDAWVRSERERLMRPIRELDHPLTGLGSTMRLITGENRSKDEYVDEVERYLSEASEAIAHEAAARAVAAGLGRVSLAIVNNTEHNFREVAVEVYVPGAVAGFFDADAAQADSELPSPPVLWGTPRSFPAPDFALPGYPAIRGPVISPGHIDNAASARIAFDALHVRPEHRHALPEVFLLASSELAGTTITAHWHATSTSVSGVDQGSVELPVGSSVTSITDLMQA
jgi:schlafen family protein